MNALKDLDEKISELSKHIDTSTGKRIIQEERMKTCHSRLIEINKNLELLEKVKLLLQKTADYARVQSKVQVESLVTKCLQYVFETDINFAIELSQSRGVPSAEFYVTSNYDGYEVKTKPEISRGGGVVDVVSISLRIAFLETHKPKIKGPLLLDEPGKHVSDDYIFNLGEFLKRTSAMFDRQIIMVTHNAYLSQMSNTSYQVEIKNGKSIVTKIED